MPSALITGSNRGIGLEFVKQYVADGWQVFATCRNPDSATQLHDVAEQSGGSVQVLAMDTGDSASVAAAAMQLEDEAIDLLLNNAGVMGASGQTFGNVDYDTWTKVLNVNTMGPLRVAEAFIEQVARSERKLMVTVTSAMGSIADNTSGGSIVYRSSKAAVNMVMRSAAIDIAALGICCVVVHPGWVLTDMGGPNALMTVPDSVTKLRKVIAKLGPEHTGKFFNYTGEEFAW
ncbi:MAG: SDR family oxidoreductase [Gammaproteobacteria bacterium]|nr:SDR family oxidoreductase [Gammaproteobacteria bacterium]